MERWETISPEAARTHPLYGFGGWIILPSLGMAFTPIILLLSVYRTLSHFPDPATSNQAYFAFLVVEQGLNVVFALWAGTNVWLLMTNRRAAVRTVIAYMALMPTFLILDLVVAKQMADYLGTNVDWGQLLSANAANSLFRTVLGAIIWIPYMLLSRRVNVTYLNRVRPNDDLAAASHF